MTVQAFIIAIARSKPKKRSICSTGSGTRLPICFTVMSGNPDIRFEYRADLAAWAPPVNVTCRLYALKTTSDPKILIVWIKGSKTCTGHQLFIQRSAIYMLGHLKPVTVIKQTSAVFAEKVAGGRKGQISVVFTIHVKICAIRGVHQRRNSRDVFS